MKFSTIILCDTIYLLFIIPFVWTIHWNGDWAYQCDFDNNDLTNVRTPPQECGPTCGRTDGCTHFTWTTWMGGTCWMKAGTVSKQNAFTTNDASMVCGVYRKAPKNTNILNDWINSGLSVSEVEIKLKPTKQKDKKNNKNNKDKKDEDDK